MNIHHSIYDGIFFIADGSSYSFVAHCLADGLAQLGIPVYSNISYHNERVTKFKFVRADDKNLFDRSIYAVFDLQESLHKLQNQPVTLEINHKKAVAICMDDEVENVCLSTTPFFCAHEHEFRAIAGNRLPIGFGVAQTLIDNTTPEITWDSRKTAVLDCFRPSFRQDVRAMMEFVLYPTLQSHLNIETKHAGEGRLAGDFYSLLQNTKFCLAYGGAFDKDLLKNSYYSSQPTYQQFRQQLAYKCETAILRWDSWRFWESLVCGCVTIHLDFDRYGFKLPVMPENWVHYVGLDLANLKQDVERLMDERNRWEEIGYNGRRWAIEHYSPIAVAKRFLKTVQRLFPDA